MKTLKTTIVLPLILLSLLFANCSTSDSEDNKPPGIFSANTIDITFDSATIEWTESLDSDGDQVTYAIMLEGQEVASGLTTLTFSFYNLESETLYTGYVESRDGKGGTNKANFFFTTDPEVLIIPVIIKEFLKGTSANCEGVNTSLEIDAGVLIPKYEGNITYNITFSTLTLNNGATTIAPVSRSWTNTTLNSYYIYNYDADNYFVWQTGSGFSCSNHPDIPSSRTFYASANGQATITFSRN